MDVHPPHQPIHTWKDFFLHLLTITIGLFIALTLESAVESMHHRHIVRDARENLRREIEANHKLYATDFDHIQKNRARLGRNLNQLRILRSGKKLDQPNLAYGWDWDSFTDSSWKSARDMGALAYMSTEAVQGYSDVYGQQAYINETAIAITRDESMADAPLIIAEDPQKLTPGEIETLLMSTAELYQRLDSLQSTMQSLDNFYINALKTL